MLAVRACAGSLLFLEGRPRPLGVNPMRIIDLSAPIAPSPPDAAPFERVEIQYIVPRRGGRPDRGHAQRPAGPPAKRRGLGGRGVHQARHPQRHARRCPLALQQHDPGPRAATIDELPLEWFFADGVVLDMTARPTARRSRSATWRPPWRLSATSLKPLDIVLIRTGRDAFYGQPDYVWRGCAVTPEATRWLYDRGVRVMGIDAWGWDGPLDRRPRRPWPARSQGSSGPPTSATCLTRRSSGWSTSAPCRLRVQGGLLPPEDQGGSAGPARVVAILPD